MLVVDASVAVAACHTPVGFARLRRQELVAVAFPVDVPVAKELLDHSMPGRGPGAAQIITRPHEVSQPLLYRRSVFSKRTTSG